jgi:two-component system KDP operon response regulator KdpE
LIHSDKILIVDHDAKSVYLVTQILTSTGYIVITANKGDKAVQLAAVEQPDLLILEMQLPGDMDGLEVARRVRAFSDLPVIFLSACAESEDMLRGFDAGADDYITKPFDPKILLVRLRAVLNRSRGRTAAPAEIVCNNLVINQSARKVTLDGVEIYLTETEFNLLAELARHRNQVLLHEQLLGAVWGSEFHNEVDYLRSYIHILRRKLEYNPSQPKMIISRSGVGYMLIST